MLHSLKQNIFFLENFSSGGYNSQWRSILGLTSLALCENYENTHKPNDKNISVSALNDSNSISSTKETEASHIEDQSIEFRPSRRHTRDSHAYLS